SGHGFYAYPQTEAEGTVKLEKRGDVAIAWLANPPMNAISPQLIEDLGTVWKRVNDAGDIHALLVCSTVPVVFSAGAYINSFTKTDPEKGAEVSAGGHNLLRELGSGRI